MSTEFAIKVGSSCSHHNCMMVNYKYSIGFKNIHDIHDLIFDTSYKNDHRTSKPQLKNVFCDLTDSKMSIFRNFSFLLLIAIAESSRFSDWGSDDRRIPGFIKSTVDWPPNPDFNSHITKSDFSPMSP